MDKLTPEQRKKNMQAVKAKGSKIEQTLTAALCAAGFDFETNVQDVFGKPDIVFRAHKTVVFCDGEFWHGKDWEVRKNDHKTNQGFWEKKIKRNMERDKEVTLYLEAAGWCVLRFWGKEIRKDLPSCIEKIKITLSESSNYLIATENFAAAEPLISFEKK